MLTTYTIPGKIAPPAVPRAVALGQFDGVHIGHRAVISRAVGMEGTTSALFTFADSANLPKKNALDLLSAAGKEQLLESLGVEELFEADFASLRDLSPADFVRVILHETLHAVRVCCGFNYHFGKGGAGDAAQLRELCAPYGIEVIAVDAVQIDGAPVSASRIRRLIENGQVQEASRLLGHPFTIDFTVVGGQHVGRLLGTPTINQPLPAHFVRPRFGVYASSVEVNGKVTHGVTNIGLRPTVGADAPLAETWIPQFSGDLYGQNVPVSLVRFLRDEMRFPSLEELQKQIIRDEKVARRAVCGDADEGVRAILFDFDDTLQNRAVAFRKYEDFFFQKYFPQLSLQEKEARADFMLRANNGGYVVYLDYFALLRETWGWTDGPSAEELYREFQFRFPEYSTLFPDTVEVLTALRQRGYLLGILTNGPRVQQNRKLDVSGLRPLVDIAVVSGDEGVHKPDPEIFRRVAARLGVACESCVYVGDHPVNDIQGAAAAHMRPIYMDAFGKGAPPENVTEIRCLSELLDIF